MRHIFLLLFSFSFLSSFATHLVGGEMTYTHTGGLSYDISLCVYRDDYNGNPNAQFDDPALIVLFDENGNFVNEYSIQNPNITPDIDGPEEYTQDCFEEPDNVRIDKAVYSLNITVPDGLIGYQLVYARCCRNGGLTQNLINPGAQGSAITAVIPPTITYQNSSPTFNDSPPIFICSAPNAIDHSATDADGDDLVYSFCSPFQGLDQGTPAYGGGNFPPASMSPPLSPVAWQAPYNETNPLGNNSMLINPNTGLITGTPTTLGTFTVGVCVSEYRNGVLLSNVIRDFQYTVVECNIPYATLTTVDDLQVSVDDLDTDVSFLPDFVETLEVLDDNCTGLTINFDNVSTIGSQQADAGDEYYWDFGDGVGTSTQFEPTYTYADTGTYIVTIGFETEIDGNICNDTSYYVIFVYPELDIEIVIDETDFCNIESISPEVEITEGAAYDFITEWNWNFNDGNESMDEFPTHQFNSPGTYNIDVLIRTDKGCAKVDNQQITIHPMPIANFAYDDEICLNETAQFNNTSTVASGSIVDYFWDYEEGTATTEDLSHDFSVAGTYDIYLAVETNQGCRDSILQSILVNPLPVITGSVDEADNRICIGDDLIFTGSGAGTGGTYNWTNGVQNGQAFTPANTGNTTYTVTGTDANGCQSTATVDVLVDALPVVTANTDEADNRICLNDDIIFTGNGAGAGGMYTWDNGVTDGTVFVPTNTGNTTYTVIGTDVNGCQNTATTIVLVDTLPNVSAMSNDVNDSICDGETIILTGSGANNYSWDSGFNDGQVFTPAPVGTNTYTVTGTDNNGCIGTATIDIEVLGLPNVVANSNDADNILCLEDSLVLFGTGAGTGGVYTWDNGVIDNEAFEMTIVGTTNYNVLGIDIYGCQNTDDIDVLVNPLPVVTVSEDTSVCLNVADLTVFNTTVPLMATGGVSYTWSPNDGSLDNPNSDNTNATPAANTVYIVEVTDANNCISYDSVEVIVLNPALELITLPIDSTCFGDTVYTTVLDQGAITTYNWTPATFITDATANSPGFFPTVNTTYTLTIQNYCYQDEDSVLIEVIALPDVDAGPLDSICIGNPYTLMASPSDLEVYLWTSLDNTISDSSIFNPTVNPPATADYYLFAIDSIGKLGCENRDTTTIIVYPYPTIDAVLTPDYPGYVCLGSSTSIEAVTDNGIFFDWTSSLPSTIVPSDSIVVDAFPSDTSFFYVTTTNTHGCASTDSIDVNVQHPVTAVFGGDTTHCRYDSAQVFGTGGFYYEWLPTQYFETPTSDSSLVSLDSTGIIQLIVSNDCFYDTANQVMTVFQLPFVEAGKDTLIQRDAEIGLLEGYGDGEPLWFAVGEDPNYAILGVNDDYDLEAEPFFTTDYVLQITDFSTGCLNYDTATINVNAITLFAIPTGFSPNGDGINDYIRVLKYLNIKSIEYFSIYNRWGELMYQTTELDDSPGWDGTFKGRDAEVGVYKWVMEGTTKSDTKVIRSGDITLIR